MNPLIYIEFREFDIRANFKKAIVIDKLEEDNFLSDIKEVIGRLKSFRLSKIKSEGILQRDLHLLLFAKKKGIEYDQLFLFWLAKALSADKSYGYSYNFIVVLLQSNYKIDQFKEIKDDSLIHEALKKEKLEYDQIRNFSQNKDQTLIYPLTDDLKTWIDPPKIDLFIRIENELLNREYIDRDLKWCKTKKKLVEFVVLIINFGFVKRMIGGRRITETHTKHYFSKRYGHGKTGLSETWKKHKPSLKVCQITFHWIDQLK